MSKYIYYWDKNNKKKVYGGKYSKVNPDFRGYYGDNDAGVQREFDPNTAGEDREFIGSGIEEYIFSNTTKGTHTIPAHNLEEAIRIAESMGYSSDDYKPKRGRRGKK